MNVIAKAGIAVVVLTGGLIAAHHVAQAADTVPATANGDAIAIPAKLEAQIRAMVRSHAPAGQADAAEAHLMAMLREHLAEVAKDPAAAAHVRQVMAAADAGDPEALKMVHEHLVGLAGEAHH